MGGGLYFLNQLTIVLNWQYLSIPEPGYAAKRNLIKQRKEIKCKFKRAPMFDSIKCTQLLFIDPHTKLCNQFFTEILRMGNSDVFQHKKKL